MYCKKCGHRGEGTVEECPSCGARLLSTIDLGPASKRRLRWQVPVVTLVAALITFVVFPHYFMRSELEFIGPTDKLKFLRALERSQYRRIGQQGFRLDEGSLIVIWDLRWNILSETKQHDIVRIVGRGWETAGGEDTRFRIDGDDKVIGWFAQGEAHLASPAP